MPKGRGAGAGVIRGNVEALQTRFDRMRIETRSRSEWRQLQYEAVAALVENQRLYVELQTEILHAMRSDGPRYSRLRLASLDAASAVERHHALIRRIEQGMHASEHDRYERASIARSA